MADGSVRLERTRSGRMRNVLLPLVIAGAMLISGLGHHLDGRPRYGHLPPDAELVLGVITTVAFICIATIMAACLAWLWTGRELWTIRNGLLEIRRECLGRKWSRGYAATELSLEPNDFAGFSGQRPTWRLIAQGKGGRQVIATTTTFGLDELTFLGNYLAARTGWRWVPPPDLALLSTWFSRRGW